MYHKFLTLKTRGRLIRVSSSGSGQQLFQGCLCKLMADNRREMLAKHGQSGSMMVTADDIESAADTPTPTNKEPCSSPAAAARCHRPWTTHLPASTASSQVAAMVSRHFLHAAGRSATTSSLRPGPSINLYALQVLNFGPFLTSKEGVDSYADRLIR